MISSVAARICAVAASAVLLAGCSVINPITTTQGYEASDGMSVEIGEDAKGVNLLLVTSGMGEPAILTGSIYNEAWEDLEVSISVDGETFTDVNVPARGTAVIGPDDAVVTGPATAAPGFLAQVLLNSDATGQFATPVPVVDGTLPEYQAVLEAIPSPEPSAAQ